jgi:ribosomal protein L37AE/L43A
MSLDDPAHTPNIVAYWEFLEAALRWQSENPQVPTEQQLSDMAADAHVCMDEVIAEWQRRMYLAPEPEVDRVDFYVKGSDGEYRPWKPTEEQVRLGGEFLRSPIRCLDCGTYFIGDSCPCKKKSNPEVLDAKQRVLAVYPGATEMPDASGAPSADYCIVRPATKEDWPENKWVQVGPYVSGDPWEAAALRIHASGVPEEIKRPTLGRHTGRILQAGSGQRAHGGVLPARPESEDRMSDQKTCKHETVNRSATGDSWNCDGCGAEFFCLGLQPGKITYTPMPEMATLRDQFAMAALNGMLADPQVQAHQSTAGLAYQMADWMMKSRK